MSELASARGDSAIGSLRCNSLFLSLLSPLFFSLPLPHGVSSTCADDHVDRPLVVRPMTWRFMITLRVTLSRNELRPTRADRLMLVLRLCLTDGQPAYLILVVKEYVVYFIYSGY